MKNLTIIWHKVKNEPDICFFYGFLLTFTLSIRKIIYFYPIKGNFNEYSAISLYLSDIFLILTSFFWLISILGNKLTVLSSIYYLIHNLSLKKLWITCSNWLKCFTWNILKKKILLIPLLLVIWAFLSIAWSDYKIIAFYRSVRFLEFSLLYTYIIYKCSTPAPWNVPRETFFTWWNILKCIFWIIIFLGLFQAIIGIWQFISQHSIGLFWLKESMISPEVLGVAKVIIGSHAYIRSYGLFPHPNVLGGFLLLSIILTHLYRRMFHVKHLDSYHFRINPKSIEILKTSTTASRQVQDDNQCSTPACRQGMRNIWITKAVKNVSRETFWWVILSIQVMGLILTFSKSALIGLIIALLYIFINQYNNVPRGTFSKTNAITPNIKMFHVKHFRRYFVISLLIFGFLLFYFKIDLYLLFIKSLQERFIYLSISIKAIVSHIFLGLGNGQFVLEMQKFASQSLEFWQFQPVHNVFLLILSELGLIGLFLFVWFLLELFHACPKHKCSTWNIYWRVEHSEKQNRESILCNCYNNLSSDTILTYLKAVLLGFIFIMLFDHYFWDIQQGQIMLWMVMGAIAGLNFRNSIKQK